MSIRRSPSIRCAGQLCLTGCYRPSPNGGSCRSIPVRIHRAQRRVTATFVRDERSSNTLENIIEAWKIIREDSRHAERVPITFVTDISHSRAQVIPHVVFRDERYKRNARTRDFEQNLYDRIDRELRGLPNALEALRRSDPNFELAPEIYRQIVAAERTPTQAASARSRMESCGVTTIWIA